MRVCNNQGHLVWTQNGRIPSVRTPKYRTPNSQKLPEILRKIPSAFPGFSPDDGREDSEPCTAALSDAARPSFSRYVYIYIL